MDDAGALEAALSGPDGERQRQALAGIPGRARTALLRQAMQAPTRHPLLLGTLLAQQPRPVRATAGVKDGAVAALVGALGGRSPRTRQAAERALIHGNVPLAAGKAALRRWMMDPRPAVRRAASRVAGFGFAHASDDVALIEQLLLDPTLFQHSVEAAAGMIPRFVGVLMRIVAEDRADAWRRLGYALDYLPQLRERILGILAARDRPPTAAELRALRGTTDGCGPAIDVYRRALASPDPAASGEACAALINLKQIVDLPAEEHQALVNSPLPHVRANTLRCARMLRTNPPMTWALFLNELRSRSAQMRASAAEVIARRFREAPPEVIAALERLMKKDRNSVVRMWAAHAFAHVGPKDDRPTALAVLETGLHGRAATRKAAQSGLDCLRG
jgi:hypothetical protein